MASSGNDDDLTIPRAAINKMIKETLPNVRVANDARELVVNCCTEFIHLISSEANEICNKSEKKTISPEHVIQGKCCMWGILFEGGSGDSLLLAWLYHVKAFVPRAWSALVSEKAARARRVPEETRCVVCSWFFSPANASEDCATFRSA